VVDLLEYLSLSLSLALQTDDFRDALVVIVSGMIFGARRFDKSSRLPCLSSYSLTQEAAPRARAHCMFSCSQIDEGRESPVRARVRVRFEGATGILR